MPPTPRVLAGIIRTKLPQSAIKQRRRLPRLVKLPSKQDVEYLQPKVEKWQTTRGQLLSTRQGHKKFRENFPELYEEALHNRLVSETQRLKSSPILKVSKEKLSPKTAQKNLSHVLHSIPKLPPFRPGHKKVFLPN